MREVFEVGKTYKGIDPRMSPVTVTSRTKITIFVKSDIYGEYSMRIRNDWEHEYVADDKHAPSGLKGLYLYLATAKI